MSNVSPKGCCVLCFPCTIRLLYNLGSLCPSTVMCPVLNVPEPETQQFCDCFGYTEGTTYLKWKHYFPQCSRRTWTKTSQVTPLGTLLNCSWLWCRWDRAMPVSMIYAPQYCWNWPDTCLISVQTKRAEPSSVIDYERINQDARVSCRFNFAWKYKQID